MLLSFDSCEICGDIDLKHKIRRNKHENWQQCFEKLHVFPNWQLIKFSARYSTQNCKKIAKTTERIVFIEWQLSKIF